jgi:hypothetical protein
VEDDEILDDQLYEAYCVRCRDMVTIENPVPVWTRKGVPALRGECAFCGGAVFRMGKSPAHETLRRPSAVKVGTNSHARHPPETIYINFVTADAEIAGQIAADLQKLGVACWLSESEPADVNWAGGVHPALRECLRMVVVLSTSTLGDEQVEAAWRFFKDKNKPILIAQVAPVDPPDALRRRPRFDFTGDYKQAFRQLLHALTS